MTRWAMGVEYDGTHFCGWQQQPQLRTVQGELERALSLVADATITAVCGGRTDAGVHALASSVRQKKSSYIYVYAKTYSKEEKFSET